MKINRHKDNLGKEHVEKVFQTLRENHSPTKIEEIKKRNYLPAPKLHKK